MMTKIRLETNQKTGHRDRTQDETQTPGKVMREGFGGQLAFCRHFNLYPDFSSVLAGKKSVSEISFRGWQVEVKTNTEDTMWIVGWRKPALGVIYAKMKGSIDRGYDFQGFISSVKALSEENLVEAPYGGQAYKIEWTELKKSIPERMATEASGYKM